jgi:hypothetical protein
VGGDRDEDSARLADRQPNQAASEGTSGEAAGSGRAAAPKEQETVDVLWPSGAGWADEVRLPLSLAQCPCQLKLLQGSSVGSRMPWPLPHWRSGKTASVRFSDSDLEASHWVIWE